MHIAKNILNLKSLKEPVLYKHQGKLVKKIQNAFRGNMHVLGQSPTGSGKTYMFSYIASRVVKKGKKVMIITDRTKLLLQAGGTIEKFGMNPYYIKAGVKFIDKTKNVFIASSQTLRNRLKNSLWANFIKNDVDLIVIDEAHVQEFNHLFDIEWMAEKFVLGFTATPKRSGRMVQLGEQYDIMIEGEPIKKLIKKGMLLNCDIYDLGSPDLSKVKVNSQKGDFSESSLFKSYDNAKLYKGIVKNYRKYTDGQKMIVFCCNVEHAIKTAKKLNESGISAKFICSKLTQPKEPAKWTKAREVSFKEKFKSYKLYIDNFYKYSGDHEKIYEEFANDEFKVLVNVDISTKGFDDPGIEVVALYRATLSLTLYLQMLGRGGRTKEGKTHFTVFDFGGNKKRFGGYDEDRDWSLWHEQKSTETGIPPMKICGVDSFDEPIEGAGDVKKGCERLILASYKICPKCGFKYPEKEEAEEVDLALSTVEKKGKEIKTKPFGLMSFEELTEYRKIKKYNIRWLYRMLWFRNKKKTIKAYAKKYNWSKSRLNDVVKLCKENFNT